MSFTTAEESESILCVRDGGGGLGPPRPGSSGMELVRLLAQQVNGQLEQDAQGQGTGFSVRFPLEQ